MFPGVGCPPLISTLRSLAFCSQSFTILNIFSPTSVDFPLLARICSAPMNSVVSERMDVPPALTSISEAIPTTGLEAKPDVKSDPPHSTARESSLTGNSWGFMSDISLAIRLAFCTPSAVALRVPPAS